MTRMTAGEFKILEARGRGRAVAAKPSKYRNVKVTVDNVVFDSKREAQRYNDLKLQQRAGIISDLRCQVRFALTIKRQLICEYVADFVYMTKNGVEVVEDAKGARTAMYLLKKKLMKAIYNVEIWET